MAPTGGGPAGAAPAALRTACAHVCASVRKHTDTRARALTREGRGAGNHRGSLQVTKAQGAASAYARATTPRPPRNPCTSNGFGLWADGTPQTRDASLQYRTRTRRRRRALRRVARRGAVGRGVGRRGTIPGARRGVAGWAPVGLRRGVAGRGWVARLGRVARRSSGIACACQRGTGRQITVSVARCGHRGGGPRSLPIPIYTPGTALFGSDPDECRGREFIGKEGARRWLRAGYELRPLVAGKPTAMRQYHPGLRQHTPQPGKCDAWQRGALAALDSHPCRWFGRGHAKSARCFHPGCRGKRSTISSCPRGPTAAGRRNDNVNACINSSTHAASISRLDLPITWVLCALCAEN